MEIEHTNHYLENGMAVVVIILMAIGSVFVFSAGTSLSVDLDLVSFYDYPGLRQVIFLPLAIGTMFLASHMDYRRLSFSRGILKSPTLYLLIISIVLLIVVLVFGTRINYARRWLRIPLGTATISFQPSELSKWAVIFFLAAICERHDFHIRSFWKHFLFICCIIALVVGLIVIEDFGTAVYIALLAFLILLIGGATWWHMILPVIGALAVFTVFVFQSPHRLKRILAFVRPEQWSDSVAYQANQSLIALGSGGLWGKGLGNGISKYGHLPEDTTDFVFAIIGEELGLAGTLSVIVLFTLFLVLGILVIWRCPSGFGRLLATAIVITISLQAALNIGVVTVMLPTKGIPLPFISGGGTSLILSAAAIGVLLNIAKQTASPVVDVD